MTPERQHARPIRTGAFRKQNQVVAARQDSRHHVPLARGGASLTTDEHGAAEPRDGANHRPTFHDVLGDEQSRQDSASTGTSIQEEWFETKSPAAERLSTPVPRRRARPDRAQRRSVPKRTAERPPLPGRAASDKAPAPPYMATSGPGWGDSEAGSAQPTRDQPAIAAGRQRQKDPAPATAQTPSWAGATEQRFGLRRANPWVRGD